jgi:hypothetical protein
MELQITLEGAEDLRARLEALGQEGPRAIVRAVNRVASQGRTQVTRTITRLVRLPASRVRRNIAIDRATFQRQTAVLRIVGHWLPLILFAPSARRSQRAVRLPAGVPVRPSLPTPAFVATMPSGHTGIFKRRLPTRSRRGRPRGSPALPITQLFGPSIPELIGPQVPGLELDLRQQLRDRLEHEITQLATKRANRGAA